MNIFVVLKFCRSLYLRDRSLYLPHEYFRHVRGADIISKGDSIQSDFLQRKKTLSLMHLVKIWHKFVQSCYILAWNPKILLPCTNGLVQKSASCVGGPCSLWVYSLLNINSYLIYKFYAIDDNIWRWKFFIIVHLWHDRQ